MDLEGQGSSGWWDLKTTKRVALALWSSGDLAIRERRRFQRSFDLPERVIPPEILIEKDVPQGRALQDLLEIALQGHGVATTGTLAQTWRFRKMREELAKALNRLQRRDVIRPCTYETLPGKTRKGWIRTADLDTADCVDRLRPRPDRGTLLSPFDPVLWDRQRVLDLFGFHQKLEIFTPESKREYGYFCLPILAGERLIGRVDLKADRKRGGLRVLSKHFESTGGRKPGGADERAAYQSAVKRYADAVDLTPTGL